MSASIAIVGAGIAGLAAAYRLKSAALDPIVFESDGHVGGRMSSERVDGFLIDKAAYTFPEYHKNLTALLGEFGMSDALVRTAETSSTFARGKEYQVKIGSPSDFLRYKLLSLGNKKDMVKLYLYAQSLGKALNLIHPTEKTFELEKESAAEYLLHNYSEEILEYVAWPIFCEIFLGNPEDNSKVPFLATLPNLTWFKIFSFREGMSTIPNRIAQGLDVRLNTPVQRVRRSASGQGYEVETGGENPSTMEFDAVIFAVPAPLILDILEEMPEDVQSLFQEVLYAKSLVAAFALDRLHRNTTMINNLCRDNFDVVGTLVFDHHKGPERMPEGKGLMTAILCEKASSAFIEEPESTVLDAVLKEVDALYPGISREVMFGRLYRWKYGAVQLPPGALAKQSSARRILEERFRTVSFAGDGLYKASLETSFNSGLKAADHVMGGLGLSGR
jgi:oxygen-dependent protoporphyrinogen oxidase